MSGQTRSTSDDANQPATPADTSPATRRRYTSPVLTAYGRVDDLIDSGVVGQASSVPESA